MSCKEHVIIPLGVNIVQKIDAYKCIDKVEYRILCKQAIHT